LGRYAEYFSGLRFTEAGLDVYSSTVDERGIDMLVRYAPGCCLEIQVKGVRSRNLSYVKKATLGNTPREINRRLCRGYCLAFLMFDDGREPDMYLIPGYAWLKPNALLVNNDVGDRSVGPYISICPAKKHQDTLDQYRFSPALLKEIIAVAQRADGRKV
jgi:hypothetical protein